VDRDVKILLVSGSLRAGSTNTALLRTAELLAGGGVEATFFDSMSELPHFNPDDDVEGMPLDPAVTNLRGRLAASDAVLFSTPEYAGALPGAFKNLLDWTVGGGETYGMPVGWVNTAGMAAPSGGSLAHDSLRTVLTYTGAEIVEEACARIPVGRATVGADGTIADGEIQAGLTKVLGALADAAHRLDEANSYQLP
jgi:NAD(P)H-dependent FMN reductase